VSKFTTGENVYDAATNEQRIDEELEASIPGFDSKRAGLAYWQKKAFARLIANIGDQNAETKASMFKKFGETIASVPPILAAPATVTSTWTVIDDDGHMIEDGTEVKIPVPGGDPLGFVVVGDVTITAGKTTTTAGQVLLQAIEPGEAANGLSGEATAISTVVFVDTITLVGASSGGVDEEDEDAYLDRLTEALQTLSQSLIVQRDFEIDARAVPGIDRALCIPGYDGDAEKEDVPLCVSVAPIDIDGQKVGAPKKEELKARQAAKVPSGVNNFVIDPTYTKIEVEAEVTVLPGYDPVVVEAAVEARLAAYLSPANAGLPSNFGDTGNSAGWVKVTAIYRNELIAEADRIAGVDRVVTLKHAKVGSGLVTQESVALAGVAPLTEAGTIKVTVV